MIEKLEAYATSVIRGEKAGALPKCLKLALWGPSILFAGASHLRKLVYDYGWFESHHPQMPVISIGNIVAGGTGKTPLTQMLVKELSKEARVAVISRGFRSQAEKLKAPLVLSKGGGPLFKAELSGDEAYLLAKNLPEILLIVGKDRVAGAKLAVNLGAQAVVLDDGMQHRRLARDFEVVLVDALDPFGCGAFLPRGFLREPPSSLARADLIVLHHTNACASPDYVEAQLRRYTQAPIIQTRVKVEDVLDAKEKSLLQQIQGKKVAIFCGLAKPHHFLSTTRRLGAHVTDMLTMPDHVLASEEKILQFAKKAARQGAVALLCTEKDFVKLPKSLEKALSSVLKVGWVKISMEIVEGKEKWDEFCGKIKQAICPLQNYPYLE